MDFDAKYDPRASAPIRLEHDDVFAIAAEISASPLKRSVPLSGGFSSHNLLLEFTDGERCVVRVSEQPDQIAKEADLLRFLADRAPLVPVPALLWESASDAPLSAMAMTVISGTNLAIAEDTFSDEEARSSSAKLGEAAAIIHDIEFEQSGELGPGPIVAEPLASYREGTLSFLAECLSTPHLPLRVGSKRLGRLEQCLKLPAGITDPTMKRQLCHGDFNQKNILIRRLGGGAIEIAAILDWEFAMSGSGIMDIGNLLRFAAESRSVDAGRIEAAYRDAGGHLDENWRQQSLFADLLAQAEFLTREGDRPRTIATAIAVIDKTLPALGV